MTILQLQRRIQEAGRIRIGQQVPATDKKGKPTTRPAKLDRFRLTSQDRTRIEQSAGLYGGTPEPWDAPSGRQWQVITETDALDVIVPPSEMSFSQWYELWSGGGCQRRCDGVQEQLSDGPCICDPDDRECKPHTRLSVMIRDLPGLGVWRIDTQGYYAAVELEGAVQVIAAAAGAGSLLPARLRLEQRQVKRPGVATRNFAVPVLDIEVTPAQMLGGALNGPSLGGGNRHTPAVGGGAQALAQLPSGDAAEPSPLLTPVPESVPERPVAPVADQAAAAGKPPATRRAGAAASIPHTGLKPRTAAQAEAGKQPDRGVPEGVAPISGEDLESMTVAQLKIRCKRADLPVSGNKADLIGRLREHASGSTTSTEDDNAGNVIPPDDTPAPDGGGGSADPGAPISDAQRRKLFATFRDHDITDQQRKAVLTGRYEIDTMNDLTVAQAAWLIDRLEQDGGPDAFKAVADEWLAKQAETIDGDPEPEDEPDAEEDAPGDTSDGGPQPEVDPQPDVEAPGPSIAERARAHADGPGGGIDTYQDRIRAAFAVLAVKNETVYEGGWRRLQDITGGRASGTDWDGADEGRLRQLARDMERAVNELGEDTDG